MSTEWKIDEQNSVLKSGSFNWRITSSVEGVHILAQTVSLLDGGAQLTVAGGGQLSVTQGDEGTLRLKVSQGVSIELKLRPFIELGVKGREQLVSWALTTDGAGTTGSSDIDLRLTVKNELEVTLDGRSLLKTLLAELSDSMEWAGNSIRRSTSFDFPLVRYVDTLNDGLGGLKIEFGRPSVDGDDLCFEDTKLWFDGLNGVPLEIANLKIGIDKLDVKVDSLKARVPKAVPILAYDAKPLTLVLSAGSTFEMGLRLPSPNIGISPPSPGGMAIAVIVPGSKDWEAVLAGTKSDRLVFDISPGAGSAKVTIGPNGLRADAALRMRPLDLGDVLTDCQLTGGRLEFHDSLFSAAVTASAKLPYFRDSEGSLTIRTDSVGGFSATWQMTDGKTWTDPTGNFNVHEPRAAVTINYRDKWEVSGKVGGQLHFTGADRLEGAAHEWLAGFADALRMEFADMDISELNNIKTVGIRLNFARLPRQLDLWNILRLNLDTFSLLSEGFILGGKVSLKNVSGLAFEGRLPRLRCTFENGRIKLAEGGEDELGFSGKLTTPGGVSASLDLRRITDGRVDEVSGTGSLSIPSMPPIAITCALGQRKRTSDPGKRDPVFLLFARTDYPIPLFPGVVLRDIGAGLGINKVLKVVEGTPHEQLVGQLVHGPTGWPDPGALESWITPERDDFDLSLVADTYIAPSQQGRETFPYVGAATLYARPTTDFVILLGANLWLMTKLDDARLPEFRQKPAARGVLALFPRHGYLELQVRTEREPRMSDPVPLIAAALSAASGELYLKATRDDFLFRVGPLRSETTLAGVRLAGQITFATYVGRGRAIAVIQGALEGQVRHTAQVALRFGPLSVTAGFRFEAEIAFETVLAGMYVKELGGLALYQRVRAYAAVSLAVWVTIAFRLVIRIWRFRKTISWEASHSTSLRLSVDLWLEVLVARNSVLYGHARVNVRLFGYEFSPSFQVGERRDALITADRQLTPLLSPKLGNTTGG